MCYDPSKPLEYDAVRRYLVEDDSEAYDVVDFGNLEQIDSGEYFGAMLWQFHKSLSHPLKSSIKMVLLKMLLEAPQEQLLCHQFRHEVLTAAEVALPPGIRSRKFRVLLRPS